MLGSVLAKTLRDQRRALLGWGIGIALFCLLMVAYFPTIEQMGDDFQKLIESYPPAMQAFFGDFSEMQTPAGYLNAEMWSAMLPLVVLLFAIGRAADAVAGEEERGALDTLLTHPVSRRRAFLQKAAGVAIGLTIICALLALLTVLIDLVWGMGISSLNILAASLIVLLLGLAFMGVSFAIAGWRGRKGLVIALASSIAVASYVLNALGKLVSWLEDARFVSLFKYYSDVNPLKDGLDVPAAIVLALVAIVGVFVGMLLFERRDLAT